MVTALLLALAHTNKKYRYSALQERGGTRPIDTRSTPIHAKKREGAETGGESHKKEGKEASRREKNDKKDRGGAPIPLRMKYRESAPKSRDGARKNRGLRKGLEECEQERRVGVGWRAGGLASAATLVTGRVCRGDRDVNHCGKGGGRGKYANQVSRGVQKKSATTCQATAQRGNGEGVKEERKGIHTLVRARLRLTLAVHPGQRLRNLAEQGLDVVARLGRRLDKHDVELFRLLLGFFGRHLPVRPIAPVTASVTGRVSRLDQREREWAVGERTACRSGRFCSRRAQ